jgi:hypothetical protein
VRLLAAALAIAVSLPTLGSETGPANLHGACVLHLDGWEGAYDADKAAAVFQRVREKGAQAVSLSAFAWTDSLDATTLRPWDGSKTARRDLIAAIRLARAQGLAVFVKPHVEIGRKGRRNEAAWRGEIRFEEPAEAKAWFASYRSFVVDLAGLCEEEDVELLAIGLELAGLSRSWPKEWSRLIADVRAVYAGRLTYCANWWGEFGETELWRELDLIGLQAFTPLSPDPKAGPAALAAGAAPVVAGWKAEAERWGKPLVLTEFGYKSSRAPWVEPWQWQGGRARPIAQQRALGALLGALELHDADSGWLAGSFVWLYEAATPAPGRGDSGFSPGGKPAERLLEEWWTASSAHPE